MLAAAVLVALAVPAAGQQQFAELLKRGLPTQQDDTLAVVFGDVDGDGDLDMVCGSLRQQNLLYLNLQRQLEAPYLLRVGQTYTLEAYARYGPPSLFDFALPYLSTTRQSIALPPFGTLGIDPMLALAPIAISQLTGVGSVTWSVPNVPAIAGISLYAQALLVPYPFQERLSNVTSDVILR